jgi:hypothetical protein
MKKHVKRLALHRETLRNLSDLTKVVGGGQTSVDCRGFCDESQGGGCTLPDTAALGTCACTVTCLTNC